MAKADALGFSVRLFSRARAPERSLIVLVDDRLPCDDDRQPLGCTPCHPINGETGASVWAAIVEKALAKFVGSYAALHELGVVDVLTMLTGGVALSSAMPSTRASSSATMRSAHDLAMLTLGATAWRRLLDEWKRGVSELSPRGRADDLGAVCNWARIVLPRRGPRCTSSLQT